MYISYFREKENQSELMEEIAEMKEEEEGERSQFPLPINTIRPPPPHHFHKNNKRGLSSFFLGFHSNSNRERESKQKEGEDLMRIGKVKEANLKFKDSVDINPYHVYKLIQVLKQHQVEFVVAPYEADAQLAWMALNWDVDAVVTNDSDLILFGCPKVITHLVDSNQWTKAYPKLEDYKRKYKMTVLTIISSCKL